MPMNEESSEPTQPRVDFATVDSAAEPQRFDNHARRRQDQHQQNDDCEVHDPNALAMQPAA